MFDLHIDPTLNLSTIGSVALFLITSGAFGQRVLSRLDKIGEIAKAVQELSSRVSHLESDHCENCGAEK